MNPTISEHEAASLVAEMFDHFCAATTMRQILGLYRNMCDILGLRPGPLNEFYPKFKAKIRNWKAQALWKKFDARASHRVYNKGTAASGTRVLVIGAGPCGLRTAIEAQLLGAKVVVVEKRDRISRNNVLHLWPFLITDLKALGAKKFYGKFCAGSIDHISIRQLQCILLKVALLLGVEVHEGVSFSRELEPKDGCGWRAAVSPEDHAVSHYEFDVLIGADGKRNTLEGFKRKEFRGKLAIAITANFINKKTEAEAKVEEISGVAFIFNQSFFKELYQTTGIDLENIVYYKDETHYFVMTAKKHSLLDKGVIIQDYADPAELLSSANVDTSKLLDYAKEAANFSTKYQMPNLEFAVNHYGKPDVAMFDFTSMFAADNSCKMTVRKNYRLLSCLVGDSLLEPFWPTGSGCARGFLSSMDAAYAIKLFANQKNSLLAVLAQRESIYRLLAQTTPENLHRDIGAYTLDPSTRYPNLNKSSVNMIQVKHLLDTDDATLLEQTFLDTNALTAGPEVTVTKRKRRTNDTVPLGIVLLRWVKSQLKENGFVQELSEASQCFTHGRVLCTLINRYRPDLVNLEELEGCSADECNEFAFAIFEDHLGIPRVMSGQDSVALTSVDSKQWLNYLEQICEVFRGEIPHVKHPKLDYAEFKQKQQIDSMEEFAKLRRFAANRMMNAGPAATPAIAAAAGPVGVRKTSLYHHNEEERTKRSRKVLGAESSPIASPQTDTTKRAKKRRSYEKFGNIDRDRGLAAAYPRSLVGADGEQFSDRIKSMEQRIGGGRHAPAAEKKPKDLLRAIGKIDSNDWNVKEIEKKIELSKKATDIGKSRERVPKWNREQFLARQNKLTQQPDDEKYREFDSSIKAIDKQLKEGHNLDLGERGKNKVASIAGQLQPKQQQQHQQNQKSTSKAALVLTSSGVAEKCHFCKQRVYLMEKISAENLTLHRSCLKCHHCHTNLRLGGYAFDRDDPEGKFYCTQHFKLPSKTVKPVPKRSLPRTPHQSADSKQSQAASAAAATAAAAIAAASSTQPSTPDSKSINFDLLDRGETPERIEFENADESISDGEAPMEVIDENEWTDRNFGTESDESDEDMSSSDDSDSDSDSDYEEAAGSPLGAQTLQLASEWISDKRFSNMVDSDDDFYGYSSEDDEADSQTEGEELARAREMRMQEVKLMPPPTLPTDTETEVSSKQSQQPVVNPPTTGSQSNINDPCTSSTATVNNPQPLPPPPPPPVESAEEKALREKMLQKLSVREQWLHSSTPSPPPQAPLASSPAALPESPKPKTSFFGGLMNSLSTLIKSDKQPSPSPKPKDSPPCQPEVVPPPVPPSPSPSLRKLAHLSPKPPPSPTPSLHRQNHSEMPPPSPTPSLKKPKHLDPSPTPSLKKHRKHKHGTTPSPTPSSGSRVSSHPDDVAFEEIFKDDLKESTNSSGRSTPHSKRHSRRPKSTQDVREDADDFLEQIKQDQAALDRRMKKVEAQKFKSNMQSIKSAVEGPRIVGVKSEKDVSKFFTGAKVEAKPKQLPNKDVSALQGVNLAKYFPTANPAPANSPKASAGTPSSVSSVEGSPMLTRKKSSEVDLMKYFGPSTAKSSPSTPSSLASPAISRKNSVESPVTVQKSIPKPSTSSVNLAPKPPVVPLPPKKNILAFQPIKKSSTESTIQPSAPVKNALAFQPVAAKKPASPKPTPKTTKANTPPKKSTPPARKSPDADEKLFDDLLKGIDASPKLTRKLTQSSPTATKKKIPDAQEQLFDDLLKDLDQSPKATRKPTNVKVSPKLPKKSKTSPKRRSPDLDEQLFEDLLGEVDDSMVDNFEEIVGLPKKQSPKLEKKKLSPKQSPKPIKKPVPAAPKMTVKRPPFKITVPVKMQETLEEIYLASLSKLDTRSASTTSLNAPESTTTSLDSDLGKVDEAFEALLDGANAMPKAEPLQIQPFQAPQRTKKQSQSGGVGHQKEEKVTNGETAKTATEAAPERTLVSQVPQVVPTTPKVTKKIVEKKPQAVETTPKLTRKESFKSTESSVKHESPKPNAQSTEAAKLIKTENFQSTESIKQEPPKLAPKIVNPVKAPNTPSNTVDASSKGTSSVNVTPVLSRKNINTVAVETTSKPTRNESFKSTESIKQESPKMAPKILSSVNASNTPKSVTTPVPIRKTVDVSPGDAANKSSPANATPVLSRKNVNTIEATPKLIRKESFKSTESIKQESVPKIAPESGSFMPKKIDNAVPPNATPVPARKAVEASANNKPQSANATPVLSRKNINSVSIDTTTPKLANKSTEPIKQESPKLAPKIAQAPESFMPKKIDNVVPPTATPVPARKIINSTTAHASPVLSRKNVNSESIKTPVLASKIVANGEISKPVDQRKVVDIASSASKSIKETAAPVLSENTVKQTVKVAPGTATVVLAKNTVNSISITASPVPTRKVEPVTTATEQPVTKTATEVSTSSIEAKTEELKEAQNASQVKEPPKERKLSTDDICFQELRKKHEAVFRDQQSSNVADNAQVSTSKVVTKRDEFYRELLDTQEQNEPLVESKPVEVPRTLSEFRSSIICKAARSDEKPEQQGMFGDKINELVMEIMPGANLDDMIDDVPVPAERKKSSFQKMFNKLQRANTIAAMEASSLKGLLMPSKKEDYKMEVIREPPVKKPSPQPVVESKDRMQISLERTAQIKEKYAKQKAPSPPKASEKVAAGSSPPTSVERKPSFKIQSSPPKMEDVAPKPAERRSPTKKQLVQPTAGAKPLERTTSLKVTSEVPKVVDRKPFRLSSPKDIDQQRSILSREPEPSSAKPFVVDFDDLLDSVETPEIVSFEDLLSSDDDSKPLPATPIKPVVKKVDPVAVSSASTVSKVVVTEQKKSQEHILAKKVEPVVVPKPVEKVEHKVVSKAASFEQKKPAIEKINEAARKIAPQEHILARKVEPVESVEPKAPLSEKEFKQAAQQITDKFLIAKVQPTQTQDVPTEKQDLKVEAMLTVLTETTDISVKEKDLFDSLCTAELTGNPKIDSSDLINTSSTSLSTLPDLVSMTQKPVIEDTAPLKVLDYTDKIKQIANHVPQEIQVYTLHTDDQKPVEPQPSTSGVTNNYAHILKDITSGLVGSDLGMSVTYEPPPPVVDRKPKTDFTTYKQMLQEKSQESPEPMQQQPQRPLRRPKQVDRSVSPIPLKAFDNSICIDPWRAKKSSSIENIAIEQVFVKQDDKVIDTFYVVPEQPRQLKRRSKSYDRLEVPNFTKANARQTKKSLDELRDYGFDMEPPSTVKQLVNPRLRHMNFEESDEDLPNFREPRRWDHRVRKCNSTSDTSKLDVDATRVDIDRESPIPRTTDFSKWEAILDRGVPYYKEPKHAKKEDIKTLERKLDDLKVERKPRKRFPAKTTIPKDYDPQEYVPRINRRFEEPDTELPKWYDPEEYVPKAQRATMYETEVPISVPRSQRNHEMDIPTSTSARPQRTSAHEMDVPISRVGGKYYQEPMYLDDYPVSHTLPRSKTASHIPYSSVSSRSHDLPSREIAKTQYSRRAMADNSTIVSRSQRLHEKANKYIRSQISKNDPNPYIREMADSDDDDYPIPTTSTSHRVPITTSSYHPTSSYGSSGSAAMSRITAKAITQPSRMTHYSRKDAPSTSSSSYRRGGESSNRRDNCAIS